MFRYTVSLSLVFCLGTATAAEAPKEVGGDRAPVLRLEAGGPCSYVTGLAFSPDGQRLYVAGWDKVVRIWKLDKDRFVLDPDIAFRVPVGPGGLGRLNALALSADGNWLAVAGQGPFRGAAGFETKGFVLPTVGTFSREMREDWGIIYVFNVRTQQVRVLRGHTGTVLSLAFAPGEADRPLLLSAAQDWNEANGRSEGALRLWDVKPETSVAVLPGLPEMEFARPSLAAWRTGAAVNQLQVAAAWGDAKLRFWDVGKNSLTEEAVSKYTRSVLFDGAGNRLLTAEYGVQEARLRSWRLAKGQTPKPALLDPLKEKADSFPQALALVADARGPKRSLAAALVGRPLPAKGQEAYVLQLLALDGDRFGTVESETALWAGSAKQPVLAVSSTGRHIAVAGNEQHEVLIYDAGDLLGKKAKPQKLGSVGTVFHSASFVARDKEIGLLLSEGSKTEVGQAAKEPALGDLVFDVARGALTEDVAAWKISKVDLTGWRVELKETPKGPELTVFEKNQAPRRPIVLQNRLGPRPIVTDYALLPRRGKMPPLLAVAVHLSGQSQLMLYDAESGDPIRQLTGHVDRIYSLAFSADGRLLVSTGEDQTICVWSLTNLPKLLGQVGRLPGVAVTRDNERLVVARVSEDSPLQGKLQKDDIIEGLVEDNQLHLLASPRAFYEAILRSKPGQEITLRLRNAQGRRDQKVTVGQAIDERKPLLSLFVTRGARAADHHWLGWTPHGPYEASDPRAEQYLGWHFNTGDRQAPTRFARAGEYRKQYYRDGLVKDLLARADAAFLPPAPALPAPKLATLVEANGQPLLADANGHYLVRQPRATVKLDVLGRSLDSLDAVTWQVADGAAQRFDLNQAAQRLSLPVQLTRGLQRVRFAAEVPEIGASGDWRELLLRYQPPAPRLEPDAKNRQFVVDKPAFTLKAQVHPGLAGEPVMVRIVHRNKDKTLFEEKKEHTIDPAKPLAVEKALQLQPGWNRVEITAVNNRALAGFESVEAATPLVWEITLFQKAKPPDITLEGIGTESPLRVAVSQFEMRGQVEAKEEITKAEWERDGEGKPAPLGRLQAGDKKLTLREKVVLKPGLQTLRLRAKSVTSDPAERTIAILFVPPVPNAALTTPQPDYVVPGDGESIDIEVKARLSVPAEAHPFQTFLVRNGQEEKWAAAVDEKSRTLTAKVALAPGPNRLQIRLRNEWGSVFTSEEVRGRFVRPPRLISLDVPALTEKTLVAATARVHSVVPLRRETVQVQVNNGQRRTIESLVERDPQKKDEWQVKLPELPLDSEPGLQRLQVWMSNTEAEAPRPLSGTVTYKPRQPPPIVELLEPAEGEVKYGARIKVRGRIQSRTPLQRVRLVPTHGQPITVPLAKLKAVGKDHELELDLVLKLGLNAVRLEATNEGGEAEVQHTVSYSPRPVRLQVDGLVPQGGTSPLLPADLADGRREFPAVPGSHVQLQGRVLWDDVDDDLQAKASLVRIFVNGFQQLPALLQAPQPGSRARTFKADLLLTRAKNRIDLSLTGLPKEANRVQSQATVICKSPENLQRLHLLIVSSLNDEGTRIEDQFKRALSPTAASSENGTSRNVEPVITYGPLTGDFVDPVFVFQQLAVIRSRIEGLGVAGVSGSDVVVFYFQGIETIDAQGNHFGGRGLSARRGGERSGVTCDFLAEYFADMPGAQVLLLDVGRPASATWDGRDKIDHWEAAYPDQSLHMAVLRYVWLGKLDVQRDDRLITALEAVLPQATRLLDVTQQVRKLAKASPHYDKTLKYVAHIADGLQNISFNSRLNRDP
jgi:WD40 repeat protein